MALQRALDRIQGAAEAVRIETVSSLLARKGRVVYTVESQDTVFEAISRMDQWQVGALAVLRNGALCGIVSERDYARKVILKGRSSRDTRVSEIMTADVITVQPGSTVDECLRTMTQRRIRHLPVVEGTELVGMISIGDLVRSVLEAQADTIEYLSAYVGGQYPV